MDLPLDTTADAYRAQIGDDLTRKVWPQHDLVEP
jgi:hypothetical protein